MTFNSNGWKRPSGVQGKCDPRYDYPAQIGFGWEEWNFSPMRTEEDGAQAAYLEAIYNRGKGQYRGMTFENVYFFTIRCDEGRTSSHIIGYAKRLEVLSQPKGVGGKIYDQMLSDIRQVKGNLTHFTGRRNHMVNCKIYGLKFIFDRLPLEDSSIGLGASNTYRKFFSANARIQKSIEGKFTGLV